MKKYIKMLNIELNIKNQYLLFLLIISIVLTCICFSYALFTTSTIKNNAVIIVTGNLNTLIESDDLDENEQVLVGSNSTKYLTLKLTNTNGINAKFNLYYTSTDDLSNVSVGYLYGTNTPPTTEGYVLTKYETNDFSKEYTIIIENNSSNNVTLTLGSTAGLENATLDFPTNTSPITKVKYDTYMNGTVVYFNPETNKQCTNYVESNSLNQNKSGCMKWYAFNDSTSLDTVNLLLDHNTTAMVAWNSSGNNSDGMNEVQTALNNNKSTWNSSLNARLITADEVAKITGNATYVGATSSENDWFYLDSNNQTKIANATNKSTYLWLYDYTNDCSTNGCNVESSDNLGYWTSTPIADNVIGAWGVDYKGWLGGSGVFDSNGYGVRPIITISKKNISNSLYCSGNVGHEYKFNYVGAEQQFVTTCSGTYKLETWGAEGGYSYNETYHGGYGGYSIGIISFLNHKKIYINVGGKGGNVISQTCAKGGYNGGGNSSCTTDQWNHSFYASAGGGATHISQQFGLLSTLNSNRNDIFIVSAGGGGTSYNLACNETSWKIIAMGGSGGGYIGASSSSTFSTIAGGGTQIDGGIKGNGGDVGSFGKGADGVNNQITGGGGGYYGGANSWGVGAGGGSGYIGNTLLTSSSSVTKHMTCYNCETSTDYNTRTNTTTNVSSTPIADYAKEGNGYAKITLVSLN